MMIFAQNGWLGPLWGIGGMILAVVFFQFVDWNRLRVFRERRRELLKEAELESDSIIAKARLEGQEVANQAREASEAAIAAKEERLGERERRFQDREVILSQQLESLGRRERDLDLQRTELEGSQQELEDASRSVSELESSWREKLANIAGITSTEARDLVMQAAENEGKREALELTRRIVERAKADGEEEARRIVSLAIQRYAGDHTSETTTAAVALKGDDIKGRIIGREGRNIRAFENATGMTVLIDDTPNAVVLSGFDPVRREIARESMERLIADGRIHPTRIEEVVERVNGEIEGRILKVAQEAVGQLGLAPVHDEIAKRLGRLYFRLSHSQNVLDHSVEVARLTALMAAEVGANVTDAMRAGLLHDLGKALGDELEGSHALAGAEFIRRYGENPAVVNGVASHHDEVEHETVIGLLVSAADAISAARPGARSEPITSYINRLKNLEDVGLRFPGVERCFALQAGREVRVFVRPEEVSDEAAYTLAKDVCRRIEDELQYPGQIRVTVIREVRCVDYAK